MAPLGELWNWAKPLIKKSASQPAEGNEQGTTPGLICLKGGDLAQEIQESGCRPKLIEISELFDREYFKEKFLLYVPK